jgi:N-acetylmuramoyl-L-alanine amidase
MRLSCLVVLSSLGLVATACERGDPGSTGTEPASLEAPLALQLVELELPTHRGESIVVYLDAGHGAPDNSGNHSSLCELEQDTMYDLALDLAASLEAYGGFVVVPSRTGDLRVPYAERVADAERVGADVFLSLHSDVRGHVREWSPEPGLVCRASHDAPGFTVLHSDEGSAELAAARAALCAGLSDSMRAAGFSPYDGAEYLGLYAESGPPGCFVDRHAPDKRIMVLRRPSMPSVIVETHNALDPSEALAWRDPVVREAFARALAHALRSASAQGLSLR